MTAHYAVTITASQTEIDEATLARRLEELVDRSVDEIEESLGDQTVILARGLGYGEATAIQRELGRRKIPSQIEARESLDGCELLLRSDQTLDQKEESEDEGANEETLSEANGAQSSPQPATDRRESTGERDGENAWGELFPDLEREPPDGDDPGVDESSLGSDGGSADPAESTGSSESVETAGSGDFSFPETDKTPEPSGVDAPPDDRRTAPFSTTDEETSTKGTDDDSEHFDAGKIRRAFVGAEEERPPYEPDGFDDRPAHVPLIAAILSLVAPGAGQVYNGRPDEAQRYASTFFLLVPWVKSVRTAWEYGEEVRTYYAPRPRRGMAKRALLFAVKWWAVVGILGLFAGWTATQVLEHRQRQLEQQEAIAFQEARYDAQRQVAGSVDAARGAGEAEAERVERERQKEQQAEYTMDDRERARRLFILGYHYCRGGEFEMCQQMMGRVTSLAPENRDAFRIQTWAGLRARGSRQDEEMPEVDGEVPTLEEFEVRLAAEGKELEDVDETFDNWWSTSGREAVHQREEEEAEPERIESESDDRPARDR